MERSKNDIKDVLVAWMSENNTQDWSVDLRFVQNMINSAHYSGIKRMNLTSSIPLEVLELERLKTDDLLALFPAHTPQHMPASPQTP